MDRIEGKIAAIVTNQQIVINRGTTHGVANGMIFDIKLQIPEIADPDDPTNTLVNLYLAKGKIKVARAFEKMSWTNLQPGSSVLHQIDTSALFPQKDSTFLISPDDWIIRVGDFVIQEEKK